MPQVRHALNGRQGRKIPKAVTVGLNVDAEQCGPSDAVGGRLDGLDCLEATANSMSRPLACLSGSSARLQEDGVEVSVECPPESSATQEEAALSNSASTLMSGLSVAEAPPLTGDTGPQVANVADQKQEWDTVVEACSQDSSLLVTAPSPVQDAPGEMVHDQSSIVETLTASGSEDIVGGRMEDETSDDEETLQEEEEEGLVVFSDDSQTTEVLQQACVDDGVHGISDPIMTAPAAGKFSEETSLVAVIKLQCAVRAWKAKQVARRFLPR